MEISIFGTTGTFFLVGLALLFGFSNGYRDSSTIVATVVSTRALSPRKAFLLCSIAEFIGAFLVGSAIVATIGHGLFRIPQGSSTTDVVQLLGCGLVAAILWGLISWWRAWPTSNNQALLGGILGSSLAMWGTKGFDPKTLVTVFIVLVTSPIIGFVVSSFLTFLIRYAGEWMTPKVTGFVRKLHIGSCLLVSCAHGSNDGQIITGLMVIALGVVGTEPESSFITVRLMVALCISIGVLMGGKRTLKKLGMKFYRIQPSQGLGAQITSAGTILSCAFVGFPASTMQVITGSVVGAGVAKNAKAVRWPVAEDIVLSWIITVPCAGTLGFVLSTLVQSL